MYQKFLFALLVFNLTFISCKNDDGEISREIDIDVKPGMNLVGKVMDGNTPIVGAVVSDGFTTAVTDDNGIYQMKADQDARFVFVSVPADCEILINDGLPVIHKRIGMIPSDGVVQKDFSLKKSAKHTRFTLMAIADVQIANNSDLTYLQGDIAEITSFAKTIETPLYGISLGDQVWDNMPFFSQYSDEIKKIGIPMFQVIGNHDHNLEAENNDAAAAQDFETNFGPTYYSYNIGDCHFVVLDDVLYKGGSGKDYSGNITQQQLDWLKEDLKHVDKSKLIIIGVHIPTSRRNSTTHVSNNRDLYDILDGYKVRILSGHTHNNYTTTITTDIEENTLGAVCGAFWTGDLCNDGSPRGYAIYEIDGNRISEWYYKGTWHPRDYQMKLYVPGSSVSTGYKDGILANIFGWHTNWTVKVLENGNHVSTLTSNIKEMDPAAFEFMDGTGKPATRPTVADPEKNNDHMFYYKPSAGWTSVTIEATNGYGIKYTQSIQK